MNEANEANMAAPTARQAQDSIDIQDALARFNLGGDWTVVRHGRPGAHIRVLYRGRQLAAMTRFTSERQRMRQGMLALVDPAGRIDRYASEPMARMRW